MRLVARAATAGVPLVMFESAQRIGRTLQELVEILGDRRAVVLRELTKIHEEVRADSLSELRQWARKRPRGEIALVVASSPEAAASEADAESVVHAAGSPVSAPAGGTGGVDYWLARSELYKLAMDADATGSVGLKGQLALSDQDALQDSLGDQEGPER